MSCAVYKLQVKLKRCISEALDTSIAGPLTQLSNALHRVESYLEYAELLRAQTSRNQEVFNWVSEVNKLSNEIENRVDIYCYFHSSYREPRVFSSITQPSLVMFYLTDFIHYGCSQITAFRNRFSIQSEKLFTSFLKKVVDSDLPQIIGEAMYLYLASNTSISNPMPMDVIRNHSGDGEFESLLGRDEDVKAIKDLITCKSSMKNFEIVVVEGAEGIGKTSIAKAVFNGVKGEFDSYAWVVFSHHNTTAVSFLKDVIRGLFDSLSLIGQDNIDFLGSVAQLTETIHGCLHGKTFLLVIDDISSHPEISADFLLDALPSDSDCKILLTSRGIDIPKEYNHSVYKIEALNPTDSLDLLCTSCNMEQAEASLWLRVKSTAEEITKMCQYVPFAIKAIGGLLAAKTKVSEWIDIRERLSKSNLLPLCYAGMPPALRACFLYASMFAQQVEFSCKMLQRLWIAEGLIEPELNLTLEDTAKFRMSELIHRNFFKVVRAELDGETKTCTLLRPIREFASQRCSEDRWSPCLSVHRNEDVNLDGFRSLLLLNGCKYEQILQSCNTGFKLLAVLELRNLPINSLPDMFGNLVLLKYLGLRGTKVTTLPKSIRKLRNLQTLDIRETMIVETPSEIESLIRLRHLLLSGSFTDKVVTLPLNIEHFSDIQTIAGVKLTKEMAERLHFLSELRKLSIGEVRRDFSKDLLRSVYELGSLQSLTIKCAVGESLNIEETQNPPSLLQKLRLGGQVKGLDHWKSKLNSLKYLYLWDTQLSEDPFSILKHLSNVLVLSLCNVYNGEIIHVEEGDFPNLRKLSIFRFHRLKKWEEIKNGALKSLEEITFSNCWKLEKVPKGLENLSRLKVLHFPKMPKSFVQTAASVCPNMPNKTSEVSVASLSFVIIFISRLSKKKRPTVNSFTRRLSEKVC